MNEKNEHFETLGRLLAASLEDVKANLLDQDFADVKDYIDHGEYGVGWELLWHLVHVKHLPIPAELIECGKKMGFDTSK